MWITQIIHCADIYPLESYKRCRSFDVIVHATRSPALQTYLDDFATEFLEVLATPAASSSPETVSKLVICLYEQRTGKVKEKYTLRTSHLVGVGDLKINPGSNSYEENGQMVEITGFDWESLYSELKSLLYFHVQELLRRRAERVAFKEGFFKAVIDTSEQVSLVSSHKWIKMKSLAALLPKLVPVGNVECGFLRFGADNEYGR